MHCFELMGVPKLTHCGARDHVRDLSSKRFSGDDHFLAILASLTTTNSPFCSLLDKTRSLLARETTFTMDLAIISVDGLPMLTHFWLSQDLSRFKYQDGQDQLGNQSFQSMKHLSSFKSCQPGMSLDAGL